MKFTDSTNHALTFSEVVWFSYGKSSEYGSETSHLSLVCHTEEIWCRYTYMEDQTFEAWSINFVVEPPTPLPFSASHLVKLSERQFPTECRSLIFILTFQPQREKKLTLTVHLNCSSVCTTVFFHCSHMNVDLCPSSTSALYNACFLHGIQRLRG